MTAALHVIATRVRLRVVRPCFISGQRRRLGDVCTVWRREAELLLNDGLAVVISPPPARQINAGGAIGPADVRR